MLVLIRLFPKGGLKALWATIETEKRNLYWEDVKPLYAVQLEGKKYLSVVLDVKNLSSIQKIFLKNLATMTSVSKTKTVPIMRPLYFPLPEGHSTDLNRYQVLLRVEPEKYEDVYSSIIELDYPKDVVVTYLAYSFGDDDIIVSMLSKDRETALNFVNEKIGNIDGVNAHDMSRVMKSTYLLPPNKSLAHKARFLYSVPAGHKGEIANPAAYEKYLKEHAPMTVIVRLFAKKSLAKLWEDIENNLPKFESKDLVPLYASQQEAKSFITVIFEAANFEVLKDVLVTNLPTLVNVRKTRTIPMLEPTYFLLKKEHPKDLDRYLISIRVNPKATQTIRSRIIGLKFPDNVFLTYLTFTLGDDDVLLSVLTDSSETVQAFAKDTFDRMDGILSYDISNQLKTRRLTSKARWTQHQNKFLSSYDKEYKKDYDDYDWTNDFYEHAAMTGAFVHEFRE